ncbi:MAG: hypothetical protein M3Z09_00150 [Acidobacteriota bacterium]|nr:hypothetical protein [Acidobacteriota bacterium]
MRTDRLALAAILTAGAVLAQDPPSRVARLNLLNGPVSFQPATVDDWTAATPNYPLTTGDHLYTDQGGRVEMRIGPDAIRLNSLTNFGFLNLDDQVVQMRLTEGAVDVRVRGLREGQVWEVDTPNGAVTLLEAGEYRIDTDPNRNATMVTVRAGFAEVNANGQAFPVRTRQTAYFAGDGQQENVQDANPFDDFDSFCQGLDRREDSIPPPRYVSQQMVGYEDLDQYGDWDPGGEYGPVWRPRVRAGWAPYHEGHWVWREPWGWTWIDDAAWGFAPFHYGRWAYDRGGWGWLPGPVVARPVYAPALVAFVGGGGFNLSIATGGGRGGEGIGWFPLGPREVYAPAYHVSSNYVRQVNITNITNVTNIRQVENSYVNRGAPGAFSAVSRQDFVSARPVQRAAFAVPQGAMMSAPVSGFAPAVAPQRESVFGRAQVGGVARPQQAIFNRPVIAHTPPPPAPVSFGARQQAIEANQGRPLAPQQIQTLRSQQQDVVQQPAVRSSATNRGFGRAEGFGRPQPAAAQPAQPAPVQDGNFGRQPQYAPPSGRFGGMQPVNPQPAPDRMQSRPQQSPQQDAPNRGFGRPRQVDSQPAQPAPRSTPNETPTPNRGFGRSQAQPEQQAAPRSAPPEAPNRGFGRADPKQEKPKEERPKD